MNENSEIKSFRIAISPAEIDDLKNRLAATRWPADGPDTGWSRGVPASYLKNLADYWADGFDWPAQEADLNQIPQYVTDVGGLGIHFLHVRSPHPDAMPVLLIHGWPSSPFEFRKVIEPLTNPADPADAFHVVIPSLPGMGFSPASTGNLFAVAQAFAGLMERLGYDRYAVQGTDAGAGVAGILGAISGGKVIGVHLTGTVAGMPLGPAVEEAGLSPADQQRAERFNRFQADGIGYLQLQSTRPQTLAYGLTDSPAFQLAWIVEKFAEWTDPAASLPEDAVDRDHLLANVSIFWFNRAGAASAHAMLEGMEVYRQLAGDAAGWSAPTPPTGVAVFAADTNIRELQERNGKVAHWSEFDTGGHFPAMETPDLLVGDIRAFLRDYR